MKDRAKNKNGTALLGRVLCAAGIALALVGALFVSVALGAAGIALGVVGYFLGASRLGVATVLVGTLSIFVGLLVGRGVMAGSYDRAVDGWFRNTPAEQITQDE